MNNRLDAHAQRLALLEQEPVQPTGSPLAPLLAATTLSTGPALESHASAEHTSSGAYNGGFAGGRRAPLHSGHRDRYEDSGPRRPNFTFPHFDGEADPLPWINKCDTYFRGMGVHQDERVWQASLHLEGVAAEWFYALERDIGGVLTWSRFIEFLQMRFGPPLRFNGMADLKALQRTGTVEDYTRQFLTILCRCDDMTHRQQTNMYTAGLGEPLRTDVEMEMPETLQRAMHLARVYERRLLLSASSNTTSYQAPAAPSKSPTTAAARPTSSASSRPRFRRLSPEEIAAKRANGECYHCKEKYSPDHKCTARGVFLLELEEDDTTTETGSPEDLGISLQAMTGIGVADTLRLPVSINGITLTALVDSGFTHTFLCDAAVSRLGLQVVPQPGLSVKVANGERISSRGRVTTTLTIGTEDFPTTCYSLPLDGFDLVLGVEWLRSLGPVICNFDNHTMAFWRQGRLIRLTGMGDPILCSTAIDKSRECMEELLQSFAALFEEPHGLPPSRRHDHHIRLLSGTEPVAVRPYRYPQLLKDEIERQCDQMLQQGIIRECTSTFSSPVLLVKKADNTWRFCIDCRELNAKQ